MLRPMLSPGVLIPRVLILGGLALCGSMLRADSIAGNILGGDTPYSNEGALKVTDNTFDYLVAQEFTVTDTTPGATYNLSGIQFVVGSSDSSDEIHTIDLAIFADNNGAPAASPLEPALTYTGTVFPFTGGLAPILTVDSVNQPQLTAGDSYWLVMSGPADESLVWYQNLAGNSGILTTDGISADWIANGGTQGAFEVDGSLAAAPAPEPAAWLLLISGIGTLAFFRQARR